MLRLLEKLYSSFTIVVSIADNLITELLFPKRFLGQRAQPLQSRQYTGILVNSSLFGAI